MTHREAIKEWLGRIELKDQLIADWGSGSKPVSRYVKSDGCQFITIDKNPLIAVDRRAPLHYEHDIEYPFDIVQSGYAQADVAFCMEVLEHSLRPDKVLSNIFTNLKTGGNLYLSVPFMFRIHSEDDYFRYTEHGLRAMLQGVGFTNISISPTVGDEGYKVKAS